MRVEVDVLVGDDESANLVVIGHDGVGQAGAGVGVGEAARGEPEGSGRGGAGGGPGGFVAVQSDGLVDGLDVAGGPGGAVGVGGDIAATLVEGEGSVPVAAII